MQVSSIGSNGMDAASMANMMAEMRKKMMEKLDTNSDESLDASELVDVAEKTGTEVDDLLALFDSDTDGTLSKTEAGKMFEAMKPKGPPPRQPADSVGETDSGTSLENLLDALDESDNEKDTANLFAQYLQNLAKKYSITGAYSSEGIMGTATSQMLNIQA